MNRIIRLLLCIFITVFAFKIQSAYPSTPTPERKGKIAGLVLDINDARVANAKITFGSGPSQSSVITGIAGEFEIELPMSDNRYSFTVQANGFCNFEGYAPLLHNKATEMINIHLEGVAIDGECKCSRRKS